MYQKLSTFLYFWKQNSTIHNKIRHHTNLHEILKYQYQDFEPLGDKETLL